MTDNKTYNTLCFNILSVLIKNLDLKTCYINKRFFNDISLSSVINDQSGLLQDKIVIDNCAFILKSNATNLIFSFGHQDEKIVQSLSDHIFSIDNNAFSSIHIILFKNSEELNVARQVHNANSYKRCFFTSFDNICAKALEIDKNACEELLSHEESNIKPIRSYENEACLHNIEVIDNTRVGNADPKLYKLTFKSEDSIDIMPGQFIMVRTLKEQIETPTISNPKIVSSFSDIKPDFYNDLSTKQLSFLKRPFGIYRTYYENFTYDYISKLNVEKEIATLLYTIKPNTFEILYKVLDRGVGTNELTKLVKGDTVKILAPLGKVLDLRKFINEDIDEIHIVGGGVGIAPLIYFAQMLKSFNFKVKAFVGVENHESLIYRDSNTRCLSGIDGNAKIYIDDLKYLGLAASSDIYVSYLCNTDEVQLDDIKNLYKGGFVTEPYAEYLKKHGNLKIRTFTCGPEPMMKKVHQLTDQYNIKSYVLMEKRMACGIGVCFSCVCKTIVNGENNYSRVCIDGPIIESKLINWNE